jgi:hypothetical protein
VATDPADDASPEPTEDARRGMSRRAVVVGIGGAATAALVAVMVGRQIADSSNDDDGDDRAAAADVPSDDEAIKRVGEAYRAAYPEEDDVEVLEAALPRFEGLSGQQVQDQLSTLRDQVRTDFAEGNIVMVDGWLLAATEARAAALVSLLG